MNRRKIYFFSALILVFVSISLLISGSSLLTLALDSDDTIPLGTFIIWIGMISLPLSIYFGLKEWSNPKKKLNRILSGFLKVFIVLGILWVLISYLLAGNIAFNFSNKATFQGGQDARRWFQSLSYGIGIGSLVILLTYWISLLFKKNKSISD